MTDRTELAARITLRATAIAARSVDAMYEDPFWDARFGARGRAFADEDGAHHVRYLVNALRADDAAYLCGYAGWLQVVLTTRGMCSAHLADHFTRLGASLRAEGIAAPEIDALLEAARAALARAGDAGAVEHAARPAVEGWPDAARARWGADAPPAEEAHRDARHLASYLADAVALERPDGFASHVAWLRGHLRRCGRPDGYLDALLATLPRDGAAGPAMDAAATVAVG